VTDKEIDTAARYFYNFAFDELELEKDATGEIKKNEYNAKLLLAQQSAGALGGAMINEETEDKFTEAMNKYIRKDKMPQEKIDEILKTIDTSNLSHKEKNDLFASGTSMLEMQEQITTN